ncbi:MAG: hypothetical protein ABSF93_05810 [Candidatus Sulfotelmatobacter sp.]|jgi:hypothetical protein
MELLLNLAWLLLALPAYWLWRSSRTAPARRKFTSLQCLLALGCLLVILFPVISATDDLLAMRSEMEESPASKRSVRQASHDKVSGWKLQSPPALLATAASLPVNDEGRLPVLTLSVCAPPAPVIERTGRAPPASLPA